jgi:hypothetical protein
VLSSSESIQSKEVVNSSSESKEGIRKFYPCVIVRYPSGWGNSVLIFLFSVLKNARYDAGDLQNTPKIHKSPVFPCVRGYGEVYGKLFRNVHQCPLDDPIDDCYNQLTHFPIKSGQWDLIRKFVWEELPKFPSLLQLNATFAEEVFASVGAPFTLNELRNSSCAVHVRFGDAYFRDEAEWKDKPKPDRRVCKDNTTASSCFAEVADRVRGKCPDPLVPIYLATDLQQFTQYFCSEERATNNRRFLSSCEEKNSTHINDVQLVDKKNLKVNDNAMSALFSMLSEWLALAFAKETSQLAGSTFSSTAQFEYFI